LIYTGVMPPAKEFEATLRDGKHTWREVQCLAVSHDQNLQTWKKFAQPVIPSPPPGLKVTGFRDPCLWREANTWMLALGSGVHGKGGAVLLYRSTDLRHWMYLHPLIEGTAQQSAGVNPVDTGEMWECPDFFALGNKHVLLISTMGKVFWKVGTYKDQRFSPEKEGVVDWGAYYAAKSMLDADGNRILWGWIPETRPEAEYNAAGWAGVMSLPRVLSLSPGHELQMQVVPAAQKLRGAHFQLTDSKRDDLNQLRIRDLAAELKIEFHPKPDSEFALNLVSEAGASFASIRLANQSGHRELRVNDRVATIAGNPSAPVRLHVFLDGSVLEVFVDGTAVVTSRVYQATSGPLRVTLEGRAESLDLHAWQINPISRNRLTSPLCD
jgi:beta-fructofuranosidase